MRNFEGSSDKSAIILEGVFPGSDLIISSPFEFGGKRSGVYIEGSLEHVEIIFNRLTELVNMYIDERLFGRWIAVPPPEEDLPRTILHYEAAADYEKVQLLNFVFRDQLAKICDLFLAKISVLLIKCGGQEIDKRWVALPEGFVNGHIKLPEIKKKKKDKSCCPEGETLQ